MSQGIQALVETCKELEVQKEDVVEKVMKKFSLSRTEAEADVEKYWK